MANRQKNVLVIDDDQTFVKFVSHVLAIEGYNVITAANGRDGLVAIRQHNPAVVLLDMGLPVMDGEALLTVIHSQPEVNIPIIVMSGYDGNLQKLPPVAGVLNKPFDVPTLVKLVAQYTTS